MGVTQRPPNELNDVEQNSMRLVGPRCQWLNGFQPFLTASIVTDLPVFWVLLMVILSTYPEHRDP
jgi:hypothetical protein